MKHKLTLLLIIGAFLCHERASEKMDIGRMHYVCRRE